MFFISKDCGDNLYEVTDTKDGIKEIYNLSQLLEIAKKIKIYGVSVNGVKVAPYDDMIKDFEVREKLLNHDYYAEFRGLVDAYGNFVGCNVIYRDDIILPDAIRIPDFVTSLNSDTFPTRKSGKLVNKIVLGSLTRLLSEACFSSVPNVKSVDLRNLSHIGIRAFAGALGLEKLVVPSSVVSIANSAFADSGIKVLDLSTLDPSRKSISKGTFMDTSNLEVLYVPKGMHIPTSRAYIDDKVKVIYV